MPRRTEDNTGSQQGVDGDVRDEQEPIAIAKSQEVLRSPPAIIISRNAAKTITVGLFIVVLLVIFQSWQSYSQGQTIDSLRCTVQNQSTTLDSQANSLDELVFVRKRQDRFNTLLRRLIIAQRNGDEKQIDEIVDQLDEEQRRQAAEEGRQGVSGPQGPSGSKGAPGNSSTTSTTRATSTSSTTTSTSRPPLVTLPTLPPIIRISSVSCKETTKKGE